MAAQRRTGGIGTLRYLALSWSILEDLCGLVGRAAELGDNELSNQCHELALRVAPRIGATATLVRRMEQDQQKCRKSVGSAKAPVVDEQ
jgi:hypothetical protein